MYALMISTTPLNKYWHYVFLLIFFQYQHGSVIDFLSEICWVFPQNSLEILKFAQFLYINGFVGFTLAETVSFWKVIFRNSFDFFLFSEFRGNFNAKKLWYSLSFLGQNIRWVFYSLGIFSLEFFRRCQK